MNLQFKFKNKLLDNHFYVRTKGFNFGEFEYHVHQLVASVGGIHPELQKRKEIFPNGIMLIMLKKQSLFNEVITV